MPSSHASLLRSYLQRLAGTPHVGDSDSDVLARFAQRGDDDAFAVLVSRHGPLVLRVCQSVLGRSADVDDAFQATFVVLARKAATLSWQKCIASWLHVVARRVSLKLRSRVRHASALDQIDEPAMTAEPDTSLTVREAERLLHDELASLPEKYRAPVVLCYFQEKTQDEAAAILGWSLRTLQRRLQKARDVLRVRLQKRGIALSVTLSAALVTAAGSQAVPPVLTRAAVQIATSVSPSTSSVTTLAEGVLSTMKTNYTKHVLTAGMILAAALTTTAVLVYAFSQPNRPQPPTQTAPTEVAEIQYGRLPLPAGATRRFGDLLFRTNSLVEYAFVNDAKVLFVRGTFRDIVTGNVVRRWDLKPLHGQIAFSHDSQLAACSRATGTLDIWDMTTRKRLHSLPTDQSGGVNIIRNIRFSRDNKTLAANTAPHVVQIWDVATGKLRATVRANPYTLRFALTHDGSTLATWQENRFDWQNSEFLQIWNVAQQRRVATVHRPGGNIIDAGFSPDGATLAMVEHSGAVGLIDARNGKTIRTLRGPSESAKIAFDPKGRFLVVVAKTGKVHRYHAQRFTPADSCHGPACDVRDILFTKDGRTMIYGRDGGVVCLWQAPSGTVISPRPGHHGGVIGVAFSRDGKRLVSVGHRTDAIGTGTHNGHPVRVWDVATGQQLRTLPALADSLTAELSPNGRYLVNGTRYTDYLNSKKCSMTVLDIANGKKIGTIDKQLQPLGFSGDEKLLATMSINQSLCLWETAALRQVDVIPLKEQYATAAALSADGRIVAYREAWQAHMRTASVKVWDRKLRKVIAECKGPGTNRFSKVALSPDGKTLASVCLGYGIAVWRSRDGKFLGFLPDSKKHAVLGDDYRRLVFSPDGKFLATGSMNQADVWNVAQQKLVQHMDMHEAYPTSIRALAFAPDSRHLVTGCGDTTILLWRLGRAN